MKKILLFILLLPSCITPVDYDDLQEVDPSLVVSSYITPDSLMEFFVGKTTDMFSDDASVSDGSVQIWNNGTLLENVLPNDTGHFVSNIYPTVGEEYRIIANGSGLQAEATTHIPASAGTIDTVYFVWPGGYEGSTSYASFFIQLDDPPIENYYELFIFGIDSAYLLRWDENIRELRQDDFATISSNYAYLSGNDPVMKENEGVFNYQRLLFTDKLFNGQKYMLSLNVSALYGKFNIIQPYARVVLRTISKDYYLHRKSLYEHWEIVKKE